MVGVRQFDEDEVLGKALALFRRRGLKVTTMQDLAEATGVLRGSLYNAYGGKERIFLRAYDRYAERFLEKARAALAGPDPRAALRRMFEVAIANMTTGDSADTPSPGCLTTKTITDFGHVGEEVQARLRAMAGEFETLLAEAFSTPEARSALAMAPDAAAALVVTFTRGLAVMERIHGDGERLRVQAEALVELLYPRKG